MSLSRPNSSKMKINDNYSSNSNISRIRNRTKITVVVRKRPLTDSEVLRNDPDIVEAVDKENTIIVHELRTKVDCTKYMEKHSYTFDHVYSEEVDNKALYEDAIRPLTENIFTPGFKCTCFAYGQTGSGKTYTMMGSGSTSYSVGQSIEGHELGIFELAVNNIFELLSQSEHEDKNVYVSFFEIYCDKIYDLLNNQKMVTALENSKREVVVKDLTEKLIQDRMDLMLIISKGLEYRRTAQNSMNDMSSRSHALLQIEIRSKILTSPKGSLQSPKAMTYGKMVFVDLAGSERGADTVHCSRQTQQDGAGINRSLLALKECIRALHDQQSSHVPFRQSELTKVLKDVFVGNAHSIMIANIGPCLSCCEQTLNTLRYAHRVKELRRNSIYKRDTMIKERVANFTPTRIDKKSIPQQRTKLIQENASPEIYGEEECDEYREVDGEIQEYDTGISPMVRYSTFTDNIENALVSPSSNSQLESSVNIKTIFNYTNGNSIFKIPGIGLVNIRSISNSDKLKLQRYLQDHIMKKQEELASNHASHLGILCECLKEESIILKTLIKKDYDSENSQLYVQKLRSLVTRKSESLTNLHNELSDIEDLMEIIQNLKT
ncbi:kinesin motor domain-containing protein [Cryptosporidium andersoni]|uniref:Kinesin-like protein n=1 Tax=Cryptosporidium andersoni TaxID=117008 RepID=A0A1J4MSS4_9CRYT|nr:kinesin motor domain-containing protein [Cryptosporidium andersoni]